MLAPIWPPMAVGPVFIGWRVHANPSKVTAFHPSSSKDPACPQRQRETAVTTTASMSPSSADLQLADPRELSGQPGTTLTLDSLATRPAGTVEAASWIPLKTEKVARGVCSDGDVCVPFPGCMLGKWESPLDAHTQAGGKEGVVP